MSRSSGGGGYGAPWKRRVDRVLQDVREGYVTVERARDIYGVVLTGEGSELSIDEAATASQRAQLAA